MPEIAEKNHPFALNEIAFAPKMNCLCLVRGSPMVYSGFIIAKRGIIVLSLNPSLAMYDLFSEIIETDNVRNENKGEQ